MTENEAGEPPNPALYARLSTDQDEVSIGDQFEAARAYAAKSGLEQVMGAATDSSG